MLSSEQLDQLRAAIDNIDRQLLELISERLLLTEKVGKHKLDSQLQTRDLERERQLIIEKMSLGKQKGLSRSFVQQLFQLIIEQSVKRQYSMRVPPSGLMEPKVAYLGNQGSYSHQALVKYYEDSRVSPEPNNFQSFSDIIESVTSGETDIGLLPIENTTSGSILEVYDLLQGSGLHIIGEELLKIDHCLVGTTQKVDLNKVTTLYGHPQALLQCSKLTIRFSHWKIEYCSSSAEALSKVKDANSDNCLALANDFAASLYDLKVVQQNVANLHHNSTRFILLAKKPGHYPEEVPCKVSILFSTKQQSGALLTVLEAFQEQEINLIKIQSRPIQETPWEELFYIDFEGHIDSAAVQTAITKAEQFCQYLKVLGCYPNSKLEQAKLV